MQVHDDPADCPHWNDKCWCYEVADEHGWNFEQERPKPDLSEMRALLGQFAEELPPHERYPDYTAVGGATLFLDWVEGRRKWAENPEAARDEALEAMKALGYDPETGQIDFERSRPQSGIWRGLDE